VEPPGGESGNIEHTWGMYNKPTGCSTPAYRAPHKQTNKQNSILTTCEWLNVYSLTILCVPTGLTFKQFYMFLTLHLCVLYGSRNQQRLFPYTALADRFCIPKLVSVYCAVHTESSYKIDTFIL
jgi:hypothetical protein